MKTTAPAMKLFRSRNCGSHVRHTATVHGVKAREIALRHGVSQGRDQMFAFWNGDFAKACAEMRAAGLAVDEIAEVAANDTVSV